MMHQLASNIKHTAVALCNILDISRKLLAGESVRRGFVEFALRDRGKVRRIRGASGGIVLGEPKGAIERREWCRARISRIRDRLYETEGGAE